MKTGKTNPLRILAGGAGALIVLGLLLLVDGITGDPISRRLADNGALAYAEKAYPGQTFTILESGGGQWFRYYARVQSEQSPDTTFTVHTSFWFFRQGEEQREVEGRNWPWCARARRGPPNSAPLCTPLCPTWNWPRPSTAGCPAWILGKARTWMWNWTCAGPPTTCGM